MTKCPGALLCALALAPISVQANLLANGSFEHPLIAGGTYGLFASISGSTLGSGPAIELALREPRTFSILLAGAVAGSTCMRRRNSV
jgi:hypothetical protein